MQFEYKKPNTNDMEPITSKRARNPMRPPGIPVRIVQDLVEANVPGRDITINLTQISSPGDTVRLLTSTSPGTGGLTINDHAIEFGHILVSDI